MKNFQTLIITPFCLPSPAMVNAAAKNGAIGILDLEYVNNRNVALDAIFKLGKYSEEDFGIKVDIYSPDLIREIISTPPPGLKFFVLPAKNIKNLYTLVKILQKQKYRIILETTCLKQAKKGEDLGIDGVIAKGNEAGGWVSNETAFILLQRFLADLTLPVWVQGGIGLHTASACYAAGASGVVLDSQLLLTRESPLPDQIKTRIALMDGSETDCTGNKLGELYRVYNKQNIHLIEKIQKEEEKLIESGLSDTNIKKWHKTLSDLAGWNSWEDNLLFLGQDTILASSLAHKFHTVGGVLKGLTEAIQQHSRLAGKQDLFRENSPIAEFHSTSFPIVQGPMSRVSDNANFAFEVAKNGALPFFALGLMVQEKLTNLLKDARHVLSGYPWGVGILGFAPQEIKDEQQKAILRYRPPFVIIAGGLPKQAQYFEDNGIISYIHVPSAPLLKMFLKSGGKRFIFEGRECGGHVGPLSSFILWETAIEVLLEHISKENDTESYKILFAGGIHDALSASMVGALAATLAQKGIQVGILIGTAYLFTKEAVKSMAISDNFQKKAIECKRTVLISSGPGHAVRCINSPYVDYFEGEKSKLQRQGKTGDEIRETLERMNLGRLQIATKGIKRNPHYMEEKGESKDKEYITIEETEQQKEGLYMIGQVAALQDKILSMRELHHNITVKSSERLQNLHINQKNSTKNIQGKSEPVDIAIIGMACIFPKSPDLQTYWHNITEKVSAIEEIPQKRWDWKLYYDPDYKTKDKINSKWGGFIPDITFDPSEYGIPPNTLDYIEPLQLLVLKSVHSALADSGYLTRPFNRKRAAVVIGAGGGEADLAQLYSFRSALPYFFGESSGEILSELGTAVPQWTGDSFPGVLMNVAAGRIANRFDLGGSNYSVDAACASSLAALRAGILELKVKEADMVIVGGADTLMSPYVYTCFSKTGTLSPSGKCHPFDEKADGIVLAEGVAAIIIKRLQDAVRDGDRIYAVIKGISSSSDGKAKGLVAPRPEGQVLVLQRAYENADIDPETIGLIEAHGTGTTAGDKTESFSLNKFFSETPMLPKSCALGSVKSVIGHTKCAAGIAGLIKTVLALYNRVLPPTLGVETPNSEINKPLSPLYVNTETRPWINNNHPRRAGVSAFGFGGTNFHTVLEEYIDPFQERNSLYTINQWPSEVFIFKGESKPDIIKAMENLQKALKNGAKPSLKDLAFSLTSIDKKVPTYCLAVVADSLDDLNKKLITAKADLADAEKKEIWTGDGIYYKETSDAKRGRLAFLYPGQGSQYVGMLNDLSVNFDQVREVFEEFDGFLNEILPLPLSRYIYPPPSFSQEERKEVDRELIRTNIAQASMGAADLAVHKLLVRLGVKPDMVAGHSYGEYVALHAAGVFSKEALALLSEARGRFILEAAGSEPGTMAAVKAGEDEVKNVIGNIDNVWIANLNSPLQTVITGTNISVEKAMERLKEEGITSVPVAVACAFHSPIVSGAQQKLQKFIRSFDFKKPVIPVFSNVTAAPYPEGKEAVYDLLVRQLVSPVRFVEEIEAIYDAGARIFIEVGAGNILSKLIDRILSKKPHTTIYTDRKGSSALVQLQHTVAQLAASGVEMDMEPLYRYRQCKKLRLESLALDTNHKEASKTICLLNGSGIQPLDKNSRENFSPRPICFADSAEYRKETHEGMPLTDVKNNYIEDIFEEKMEQFTAKEKPSNEFQSPSDEKVIIQFQKLMSQFLDTQKNVMLAYLQGQTVSPPVLSGENMERKSVVSDSATISPRKEESITREELAKSATINFNPNLQAETFPSSASDRKAMPPVSEEVSTKERETDNLYDIESRFLSIVSERTGYPAEMLDLDLNLEADLGIDSIKKIEIIGTFKDEIAKSGIDSVNPEMESLSKSTTLRDIISQLKSSAGEVIPDKKTEAKCIAPEDEVILNHKEISERLLAIVEERTGYPLEMLNIDLDMEADLGIDSIKKIEILGHLRQVLEEKMGDSFDLDMEQASKIKTLGGMINWLSKEAGSDLPETELNQSRTADNKASHQDKKDAPGEAVALPEIKRYVLDTKEIPLDSLSVPLPPEFPVIVTGDKKNKVTNYVLEKFPCRGDFVCWLKTPGRCWQQDDMQVLLPRMCQADIWVFAT
ncbi:MAG: beta-ketoacyl synthase N-terminal-like domain-containing protein, partial [Thermodesulfobacteriota bacterium]|nr:beta-ketoacyl synthase N-terminal-like domain-containing protein [Thermodesulfobacteriota bacterium]